MLIYNKTEGRFTLKNKQMGDEMLFLNTPISDDSQDIIGVNTYVEKLNASIDSGVQMIAVTSPFGSGKTSISELLEKKRNKSDEKIIKISMWSQFNGDNKKCSTNDLHRAFVYQLSSQISHKRGTYINRRLSTNYGLFKLHANKTRYWIIFILAILLLLLSQIITTFSEQLSLLLSFSENIINLLALGTTILGLVLGLIAITMSEIIFSSKQTEGKRIIESTEIIDLYRSEILGHGKSKGKCYIVIIEDLDRSSDAEAVIGFLKELRKYYVPEKGSVSFKNRVIFITNVKPEALLLGEKSVDDLNNKNNIDNEINESLYAKLFDYVLNLQTINIDNYDAVLEGLLQEKKEQINMLGMPVDGRLSDLPGMKWIIRERRIGIREIKERLNIAFTLYQSLKSKFPQKSIEFEKCAVVAYLTTAFEQDFYKTDDRAFQKLINLFIQNALDNESCKQHLENTCAEYRKTVQELISIKLIDSSYRTYFYNYPKGSYLYSFEELEIINAILYAEQVPELEKIALQVSQSGSPVIHRSLDTLKQLRLPLPDSVFESETLYVETLSYSKEQVMEYIIHSLDYSSTSVVKTIDFFKRILTYEEKHKINNKEHAFAFCMIWETKFNEDALLQLRSMLCKEFPNEIIWYKPLFIGVHNLISETEMASLALMDAVSLINPDNENITVGLLKYILQRFNEEISTVQNQSSNIEKLLSSSKSYLEPQQIVPLYLEFMDLICQIIPSFEDEVIKLLHTQEENNEVDDSIFEQYQMIINKRASSLSAQTIKYISQINCYNGYNAEVAEQLYRNEYYLDYALIILHLNMNIQFEDEKIKKAILNDIEWLIEEKEYFFAIRKQLVKCESEILLQYSFMFSSDCPIMTSEELRIIQENVTNSDEIIMKLILAELVSEDNYEMLSSYFNRKKQGNNMTMEILMYFLLFRLKCQRNVFILWTLT